MALIGLKVLNLIQKVEDRWKKYASRRCSLDEKYNNVDMEGIYPWDLGSGALFRNVENLSLYHYCTLALEMSRIPNVEASDEDPNKYREWCKTANPSKIYCIRCIVQLHCLKPDGMTATDVCYLTQEEGISMSQVKRVISYGFEIGALEKVTNGKRERYFKLTDKCYQDCQEIFRVRFCNPKSKAAIGHLSKLYQMAELVHDKRRAEQELGLIHHDDTMLQQIMDAYHEEQNEQASGQSGPELVLIESSTR